MSPTRLVILLAVTVGVTQPQTITPQAPPKFEVASIKQSADPPDSLRFNTNNGRIKFENVTLSACIIRAYELRDTQLQGGPKWLNEDRYYIEAKAEGRTNDRDLNIMLQNLLIDRFKLAFHRETKSVNGYALVLGKGGLKAKPSGTSERNSLTERRANFTSDFQHQTTMDAQYCTMTCLAKTLSGVLHTPVVDATNTESPFDFKLSWTADDLQIPASDAGIGASIFAALQEQLGLKLESRKVPTEVLVIDNAERPTEN